MNYHSTNWKIRWFEGLRKDHWIYPNTCLLKNTIKPEKEWINKQFANFQMQFSVLFYFLFVRLNVILNNCRFICICNREWVLCSPNSNTLKNQIKHHNQETDMNTIYQFFWDVPSFACTYLCMLFISMHFCYAEFHESTTIVMIYFH